VPTVGERPPGAGGYDFVLTGRLRPLPDRRVIACASTGGEDPPACVISAEVDRVRIEAPGPSEVLAEWSTG
jgi:hypothetical protein